MSRYRLRVTCRLPSEIRQLTKLPNVHPPDVRAPSKQPTLSVYDKQAGKTSLRELPVRAHSEPELVQFSGHSHKHRRKKSKCTGERPNCSCCARLQQRCVYSVHLRSRGRSPGVQTGTGDISRTVSTNDVMQSFNTCPTCSFILSLSVSTR